MVTAFGEDELHYVAAAVAEEGFSHVHCIACRKDIAKFTVLRHFTKSANHALSLRQVKTWQSYKESLLARRADAAAVAEPREIFGALSGVVGPSGAPPALAIGTRLDPELQAGRATQENWNDAWQRRRMKRLLKQRMDDERLDEEMSEYKFISCQYCNCENTYDSTNEVTECIHCPAWSCESCRNQGKFCCGLMEHECLPSGSGLIRK